MTRQIAVAASIVLLLAACGDATGATTTAPPTSTTVTMQDPSTTEALGEPSEVQFVSGGFALAASWWQGGTTWVVLGHMLPTDMTSWHDFADDLQQAGYSVLAYDNRGFGASEGSREPFALYQDATQAIAFAHENGARHVVYGGASMNGATAVTLGAYYELAAIIVLSGVTGFPSVPDAIGALFEVDEPIMFVAAEDDEPAMADLDRFLDRSQTADFIVLRSGGHGTDMLAADPDLAGRLVEWLVAETP